MKGRTQATATKLSVPKPVNLPSMKKVSTHNKHNASCPASNLYPIFSRLLFDPKSRADALPLPPPTHTAQEHAGNDPHAQLVPTSMGGWNMGENPAGDAPACVGPTASALADPKQALSSGAICFSSWKRQIERGGGTLPPCVTSGVAPAVTRIGPFSGVQL